MKSKENEGDWSQTGIDEGPIVVAVDSSGSSRHALEEAVRIAAYSGAEVYAVNYIYDEEMETFCRWLPDQQNALIEGRRARLMKWLDDLDLATDDVNVRVSVGHPFSELIELVEDLEPGMLVVGMHGTDTSIEGHHQMKYFARACLGSGATDVLFVRDYGTGPFRSIVAAIDFSMTSRQALRKAAAIALIEGCPLHVVHVFSPDWQYFGDRQRLSSNIDEHLQKLVERFDEWIEEDIIDLKNLEVTFEIRQEDDPPEGIISYAAEKGADLIVVGLVGRGHTHYRFPGSTAEKVLALCDCSILATRPAG